MNFNRNSKTMNKDTWSVIFSHCDEATRYSLKHTCKDFSFIVTDVPVNLILDCTRLGYLSLLQLLLPEDIEGFCRANFGLHLIMQERSCEGDHFEVLKFLHISWNYNTIRTIERAAYLGRIDILHWYYKRNLPFFEKISTGRMVNNSFRGDEKRIDILKDALLGDQRNVCDWLTERNFTVNGFHHYPVAIESGKIEMLDWVYSKIETPYGYYFEGYTGTYTIEVIEWLDSKGADFTELFFCIAIKSNRIDILEWMIQNGKKLRGKLCSAAIQNKNMDILKWLLEHDYRWDKNSFDIVWQQYTTEGISEFFDYYNENI